jgi:uncharacterized protein (TIGR03067 family)
MKQSLNVSVAIALTVGLGAVHWAAAGDKKKTETEVEGAWKLVKGGKGAPNKITFTGNKFVLTLPDDRVLEGTFKLNTKEIPSWMDMTISGGSDETDKGKVVLGIYSLDEGLNWCSAIPGRKRRPQEFAEVMGDARLLLGKYVREKK